MSNLKMTPLMMMVMQVMMPVMMMLMLMLMFMMVMMVEVTLNVQTACRLGPLLQIPPVVNISHLCTFYQHDADDAVRGNNLMIMMMILLLMTFAPL